MSARLPDGSLWNLAAINSFNTTGYGSAVGVGGGRIYTSSSEYGLRKKYLADPIDSKKFALGSKAFIAMFGDLQWGPWGFYGDESKPLPWGRSAELDYFLAECGHVNAN